MIWAKTDAGRLEMQARALVKERPLRNLLLTIDGTKSQQMLLANLAGISAADFERLQSLGLIVPLASGGARSAAEPGAVRTAPPAAPAPLAPIVDARPVAPADVASLDYARYTTTLTQLISKELGLRGFVLTLAVEKADSIEALRAVGERALAQIAERKGEAAADAARRALYGV